MAYVPSLVSFRPYLAPAAGTPTVRNLQMQKAAKAIMAISTAMILTPPIAFFTASVSLPFAAVMIPAGALLIASAVFFRSLKLLDSQDVSDYSSQSYNRLFKAVLAGNKRLVKFLLAIGANPNTTRTAALYSESSNGDTPVHYAVRKQNLAMLQLLIDAGADLDVIDGKGWAPLHYATNLKSGPIVQRLAEYGAQKDVKAYVQKPGQDKGTFMTPLEIAGLELNKTELNAPERPNAEHIYKVLKGD